jgi:hypothetical protein
MKLDHFFILTEPLAGPADLLVDLGLVEGTANDHPGQGTSNRRFFFSNSALELLYVRDALEAETGPGRRLRLPERAGAPRASPFGLIMRAESASAAPFTGWAYQPDYLPPDCSFLVGENSDILAEPLCVCMPSRLPRPEAQAISNQPFAKLSELRVHVPVARPSPVLEQIAKIGPISLFPDSAHLLEIVFNEQQSGQSRDLRPDLPLVIWW